MPRDRFGRRHPRLWRYYHDVFFIIVDDEGKAVSQYFMNLDEAQQSDETLCPRCGDLVTEHDETS